MDKRKIHDGIKLFLEGLGLEENDQHTEKTAERVMKAWTTEFGKGYWQDLKGITQTFFVDETDEMIIVKNIPFMSFCAHHIVPFVGQAKVAYIPKDGKIVGLSKIARVVDHFASMLQIQERLTQQIAKYLQKLLDPMGVGVIIEAEHFCMSQRGIKKPGSKTVTSSLIGVFRTDPRARAEFLSL
jgi:GTP cyclohydrolase I